MDRPLPLERYRVIETRDLDEARESVARYFWNHGLVLNGAAEQFDTRFHHAPLRNASLNFVRYGADLTVDAGEPPQCYMIKLILRGGLTVDRPGRNYDAGAGQAVVTGPDQYLRLRFRPGTDIFVFKVPDGVMDERAGLLRGLDGPRLPGFHDRAISMDGPLASFRRALFLLREEFDAEASLVGTDLGRSDYEEFLLAALLRAWPGVDGERRYGPQPRAVRRVVDFICANADAPVALRDLVAVSGLGASALYDAFRSHVGCTPMQFLRRRRLMAARRALADPADRRSVTEIALAYGFNHLGRFSATYRDAFGETPVVTRRRVLH
jgi:AraC-like DNA-binding protein